MIGFGKRIREARETRGDNLSQGGLGKLVGKSQSTIDNWEHENTEPSLSDFQRLGDVLRRPAVWLAFGDDGNVPPDRVDKETLRIIVAALERRISRKRFLRPDPDGRAKMILAMCDMVSERDVNDDRPIAQFVEELLDTHVGKR